MFAWLRKSVTFAGSVLFRGTFPLRKENFDHLRGLGVEISEVEVGERFIWGLELNHPVWGKANLFNSRHMPMPPEIVIEWDAELTPDEAGEVRGCGTSVQFTMESGKNEILRDRKNALHYLNAILGEEGLAAMDHVAQKIWPRGALEIETAHDADLDVDGIMTYHWVTWEDRPFWLHSHGLGEIGFVDFDILNPNEELQSHTHDLLRALAFKSLEGEMRAGGTFGPLTHNEILAVGADEFMAKASAEHRAIREGAEEDHRENRVVLCDPKPGGLRGMFGAKPRPARVFSEPYDETNLIQFSTEASELMGLRAKATLGLFARVVEELAPFEPKALVKLGCKVDNTEQDDREYMWFEFHGMKGEQIDGTLINQPFHIASMKEGDRGLYSREMLTDWMIFTPVGRITPAGFRTLRLIRQKREELLAAMKEAGNEENAD